MAERKMPTAEDFPSNANGPKEELSAPPSKVAPRSLKGTAHRKKSSVFNDIKDEFISEDAPRVGSYILYDVLLPALKDLILDIAHGAIDMAMGGGGRGYGRNNGRSSISFTPYNRYYYDDDRAYRKPYGRARDEGRRNRRDPDPSSYTFRRKKDADDMLDYLCDCIDQYGEVEVGRFFDELGEDVSGMWNTEQIGWRSLGSAKVLPAGGGEWYIDFPRMKQL